MSSIFQNGRRLIVVLHRGIDGIEKVSIIDIFWGLLFGLVGSG
jgi:hypothetical protein